MQGIKNELPPDTGGVEAGPLIADSSHGCVRCVKQAGDWKYGKTDRFCMRQSAL